MPASSMCCMIPPMTTRSPSPSASTSTSNASSRKRSIRIGCSGEALTASRTYSSSRRRVVHDRHRAAAEHVRGPHEHRVADALGHDLRLLERGRGAALGLADVELVEERLEALAVLGDVGRVGARAEDLHAGLVQRHRQPQRRLAAELHDDALRLLLLDDVHHVLEGERLEVQAVGRVVVGRDRLGVAVDHDGLEPLLLERERRVAAAVVELDALPDAVGAAAEDHDLAPVGRVGLALALVRGVEVRRERLELRRAGVDALVDGHDRRRPCARRGPRPRSAS